MALLSCMHTKGTGLRVSPWPAQAWPQTRYVTVFAFSIHSTSSYTDHPFKARHIGADEQQISSASSVPVGRRSPKFWPVHLLQPGLSLSPTLLLLNLLTAFPEAHHPCFLWLQMEMTNLLPDPLKRVTSMDADHTSIFMLFPSSFTPLMLPKALRRPRLMFQTAIPAIKNPFFSPEPVGH
jgi:hypothetical protein